MLALLRIILFIPLGILVGILGCLISLCRQGNPQNVYTISRLIKLLFPIFGVKVEYRLPQANPVGSHIYICNHQSNYDVAFLAGAIMPRVVGVGKKSIKYIPIFGQMFWLSGNVFIDRNKKSSAKNMLDSLAKKMFTKNMSIWMFPEGTRNRGKTLLPFKMGAFHIAMQTKISIIPVTSSKIYGKINLNRWNNGHIIVEMLDPIDSTAFTDVKVLAKHCHGVMLKNINKLNKELAEENGELNSQEINT